MSLTSGVNTAVADNPDTPVTLVAPTDTEHWNYIDLAHDPQATTVDALISFDSGNTWTVRKKDAPSFSGPFPKSTNRVLIKPMAPGVVAGLIAYARNITFPRL